MDSEPEIASGTGAVVSLGPVLLSILPSASPLIGRAILCPLFALGCWLVGTGFPLPDRLHRLISACG